MDPVRLHQLEPQRRPKRNSQEAELEAPYDTWTVEHDYSSPDSLGHEIARKAVSVPHMPVHQDFLRRSSLVVNPPIPAAMWASNTLNPFDKIPTESQTSSTDSAPLDPQPQPDSLTKRAENLPPKPSTTMCFLLEMPRLQNIILRPNASIDFNGLQRRSAAARIHQEAALGQTRGTVVDPPCVGCKRGFGPFTECVAVKGHFGGYCANCYYTNQELRCNLAVEATTHKPHRPGPVPNLPTYDDLKATNTILERENAQLRAESDENDAFVLEATGAYRVLWKWASEERRAGNDHLYHLLQRARREGNRDLGAG